MNCKFSRSQVAWECNGSEILVSVPGVDQAVYSTEQDAVVVLAGSDQDSKKIFVYELNGALRCTIEQPADTYFRGLGPNRGHDVAIFSVVYHIGWRDWWLSIDSKSATDGGLWVKVGKPHNKARHSDAFFVAASPPLQRRAC